VEIFPIILVVLILVAVAYAAQQAARKRREAMAALAHELQGQFFPDKDRDHHRQYQQFGTFRVGSSRTAYNTIRGHVDIGGRSFGVTMGDYRYTTGSGDDARTYEMSYAVLTLPFTGVPSLFVRPEGLLDKLAGTLGFDDIDFESAEFSGRFHVTSDDKRFAYDVVHPKMMEFLLAVDPPKIELAGGCLLLARGTVIWKPEEFQAYLAWARQFFELWPAHVVTRLRA
jgi:hypothetical protein